MIRRDHQSGDTASTAIYSDCEAYRYSLTRVWDPAGRKVMFVMLNPSTASELRNDPTVERCERRARTLGFGAFQVTNIFAWRATEPKAMRAAPDPEGPDNGAAVLSGANWADQIIAAWGVHGEHRKQGVTMRAMLEQAGHRLFHLGLTKAGHPRHPLYLRYDERPRRWI